MRVKTLQTFKIECERGYCNRGTMQTDNCFKEYKQEKCYKKYVKQKEKEFEKISIKIENTWVHNDEEKIKWEKVCRQVDERDLFCVVWNKVLTEEEKQFVKENFSFDMNLLNQLDHCHIISRTKDKSKLYDINNIFLAKRFFHQRLDQYKDLVTGQKMNKERREWWLKRIKKVI